MKLFARISSALAVASVLSAAPVSAQLVVDGGWQSFNWTGVGEVDSPFGSFAFNPVSIVLIRITDAFIVGDQFRLSWTGTSVGFFDTSTPLDDGSSEDDPDAAFANPDFSSGSALFGPGNYTFTLETIALATDHASGSAYIRADAADSTVPEPATMTLLATGLAGMAAARRRKKS